MSIANSVEKFDLVVVGAGPAGSIAARQASLAGVSVLLVDRAAFPRSKVCGCCVNGAAVEGLTAIGLGSLFDELDAVPLHAFEWHRAYRSVNLSLPGGYSVSRTAFDQALVDAAITAGVTFRDRTSAVSSAVECGGRSVSIRSAGETSTVHAKVVVDAGGLSGVLAAGEGDIQTSVAPHSHMGVSAIAEQCPATIEPGTIYMADGPHGYVGVVRLEDNRMDIAAAVSPQFVQSSKGPGEAVAAMFDHAGFTAFGSNFDLQELSWQGTPLMTRRCIPPVAERLFLIGDAARYVEPFTGEGIAWAIASARAVVPTVLHAMKGWTNGIEKQWRARYSELLRPRQNRCISVTRMLRRRVAPIAVMGLLRFFPLLAWPAVRSLSRSFVLPADANSEDEGENR